MCEADEIRMRRARDLRRNSSAVELRLWRVLRDRRLAGFKFVRQAPVGPFFADFLCRSHKLIVEVDGATHSSEQEIACDHARTVKLQEFGYRILRVGNLDVYENLDGVVANLLAELQSE